MYNDHAFVLHKKPYKDSSELVKLITEEYGIIDVIAKGSRRPKTKLKGQLQPFILTQINFIGKSPLKTLINAEQQTVINQCSYTHHVSLLYCNELLVLLKLDEEAAKSVFKSYEQVIGRLLSNQPVNLALREFEWLLCCVSGYELTVPKSVGTGDFVKFDYENGLVEDHTKQGCLVSSFTTFLAAKRLDQKQTKDVSRLMREVVKHMIGGKTIESRRLLKK